MPIKNYNQASAYLESFINYEKKSFFPYKKNLKLERVKLLFGSLEIPYSNLKVIHIAGTKGKGSVAHFCANILAASGNKVGLYTSPHFFDFRERVQILERRTRDELERSVRVSECQSVRERPNDERPFDFAQGKLTINEKKIEARLISKRDVALIVGEMRPILEKLKKNKEYEAPSFFEVYTALALKYFLKQKCDFAVLETGLGGRLDATNVVTPLVSVITHIGYDHMDKLGNTLSEIAHEKAGIIKRNVPVVSAPQEKNVLTVIKKKCKKMRAPLLVLGKNFHARNIRIENNRTWFDFSKDNFQLKDTVINIKGRVQVENAACALAAASFLIKNAVFLREGSKDAFLEGRFEAVSKNPLTIVDVAHNLSSFKAVNDNLKTYFPGRKVILIFGASKDKDVKKMLKVINYDTIILTTFRNPRAFTSGEIRDICGLKNAPITSGIKEAYNLAKRLYNNGSLILISGSFFLVAEAKKAVPMVP